jgi:hypothetical protein
MQAIARIPEAMSSNRRNIKCTKNTLNTEENKNHRIK